MKIFFFNLKIMHSFIICNCLQDMKHILTKFENLVITTHVFITALTLQVMGVAQFLHKSWISLLLLTDDLWK